MSEQPDYSPFPRPWTPETMTQLADYAEAGPVLSAMERDLVEVVRLASRAQQTPATCREQHAQILDVHVAFLRLPGVEPDEAGTLEIRLLLADACESGAAALRAHQTPAQAWTLLERGLNGKERIEGIALTNEAASKWVSAWFPEGCSRSSIPYKVFPPVEDPRSPKLAK